MLLIVASGVGKRKRKQGIIQTLFARAWQPSACLRRPGVGAVELAFIGFSRLYAIQPFVETRSRPTCMFDCIFVVFPGP
jgi:hypothetical protein